MYALPRYFLLSLPDELVAHAVKHWHHYLVEEMMPLDVEISGFGRHAEPSQVVFKLVIALLSIRIGLLELLAPLCHLAMSKTYDAFGALHVDTAGSYGVQEDAHGDLAVMACALIPNVPDKQGIYGARIILEILSQVENGVVVECHCHTHVV